jgi:hypothetical protein
MELRDHPLMSFAGRHSWPPVWTWIGGKQDRYLTGEVGILKEARLSESKSPAQTQKCFLVIEHEDALYMGCLLIGDPSFCRQLFILLQDQRGHTIESIGSLDVGYTF